MSNAVKFWAAMVTFVAAVIALVWAAHAHDEDRCQAAGGHLVGVYRSWICVSADGRVIE